uniref:Reverse transcriptase domain-containing protein n=1 Tax=Tanacetum cinerariifolium TaxID=118510 RepID=A0A6L2KCN7_TANCI|nr:hypothetical protein [Tanacetum cinerariifolium]
MRRIGKGFSGVDTPLFDCMLVPQQAQDVEDAAEDEDDVNEVSTEPTPPSPTPATPPLLPHQEHIPSPPEAETAQSSPPPQQQPSQTAKISMTLLNQLLEKCATLTKQVANLEQFKVAQAIEIIKLKQRVRRVESSADTVMDDQKDASKQGGIVELDVNEDVTLETVDADVQGRLEESQAKVYHLDLKHAEKVLTMQDTDEAEPSKVEEVIEVVTAAKLMTEVVTTTTATTIIVAQVPKASALRRRRGVIIQDPEETATASDEAFARELKAELNANINWIDVVDQVKRKERQDNTVMRYQALKRKPITKAHARKNMMVYLKNMVGFKMDFFRGMTYTDIRPIFEKHYNLNQAFLERVEEEVIGQEEKGSKRKSECSEQRAAKKQRIDKETKELKTHLHIVLNDDDVYTKATPLALKTILLVERKYPLTRFTMEQMLNNVRLEVEEESEMSLELLRLVRRQLQEGYKPE